MRYKNFVYIALSTLICLFLALPASAQRGSSGGGSSSTPSGGSSSSSARPSGGNGGGASSRPSGGGVSSRPSGGNGGGVSLRPSGSYGGGMRSSVGVSRPSGGFQGGAQSGRRGPVFVDRQGNILRNNVNNQGVAPRANGFNSRVGIAPGVRAGVTVGTRGSVSGGIAGYRSVPQTGLRGYWGNHGYYHYNHGYYGSYYLPRLGFTCSVLPYGYYPFYFGDDQYYYSDGLYYTYDNNQYTVVEPPIGAEVTTLPDKAQSIVINGQQYYELNGVYYQPVTKDDGTVVYQIAGKDGELNTNSVQDDQQQGPQMGDIVNQLPPDCKKIKVNGTTLYISPDGIYYQKQVDANGYATYKIVGMPSDEPDQQNQ